MNNHKRTRLTLLWVIKKSGGFIKNPVAKGNAVGEILSLLTEVFH